MESPNHSPLDFAEAHTRIVALCDHFDARRNEIMAPGYKEDAARNEFITPFFEALGWDVRNTAHRSVYEKDVVTEKREDIAGTARSADYAFRRPGTHLTAFFVEAKKPSVDIRGNAECFQAVLYGWNASTPLVILTDFEQFLILDARSEPDKANASRHILRQNGSYSYNDYRDPEKFGEIWGLLERRNVSAGSLDKAAAALPRLSGRIQKDDIFARGTGPVDETFLAQMEVWREKLAKSLKRTNHEFDGERLTSLTQRILDRLVFLRFLEDRGIERDVTFAAIGKSGSSWRDFLKVSRRLDARYNGIIYKNDPNGCEDKALDVDEGVFAAIAEKFAPENSKYLFASISVTILGSIYERFLGNVIVARDKTAIVEPKPEVRKAGGVYYTPDYIVRYIVSQTVGHLIAGKRPVEIEKLRFADIACGSGSFLVEVFACLIRYHVAWYLADGAEKWEKKQVLRKREIDGDYVLALAEKRRILLACVYGIDLDPSAVEVTQLSLYLRLMEDESFPSTQSLFDFEKHALLPDLRENIICGNSLIETDVADLFGLSVADQEAVRPLDLRWHFPKVFGHTTTANGFDALVGNPPYDVVEKNRGEASWPHDVLIKYVRDGTRYPDALGGKLNLFRFFIVRAIDLVKSGGRIGMIIPLALLADISCAKTRRHLLSRTRDLEADCFPQKDNPNKRVFRDAKLSTMVFAGRSPKPTEKAERTITLRVFPANQFTDAHRKLRVRLEDSELIDKVNLPIPLASERQWKLCKKLHKAPGVIRLGDLPDYVITRGEINQTIYRDYIVSDSTKQRLLKGVEVGPYIIRSRLSQGEREWLNEQAYLRDFPKHGKTKDLRRIATQRITGVDERLRVVATIIDPPAYFADSTNSIVLQRGTNYSLQYLLAILNSPLIQWRFQLTSSNNNVATNELNSLPIPTIDFTNTASKARHDQLGKVVDKMLAAKAVEAAATDGVKKEHASLHCAALERQIATAIFDLYGIADEDEIALINDQILHTRRRELMQISDTADAE